MWSSAQVLAMALALWLFSQVLHVMISRNVMVNDPITSFNKKLILLLKNELATFAVSMLVQVLLAQSDLVMQNLAASDKALAKVTIS